MDQREVRFRNAADGIIRSNRKLRDRIQAVKPFYLGASNAPVPPIKNRLEMILNPKCNGACPCFERLTIAAKEYRPGEYPVKVLDLLHTTTLDLIHNEIEPIQRTMVCNMLVTLVEDLHGYLSTSAADFKLEDHCLRLDKFRRQWSQCCCKNSDAFYERTSELIKQRETPAAKPPRKKKRSPSCGKGPQSDFKRQQREVFLKFLERRPITPSVSAITRAHQCWNEHKKEWDAAAKKKIGYTDYKSIARAI